ncbi:uncharacterized protein LOC104900415 [Beta vulgaris subsp. vulgaris]|uniref:uncharacterized protein LOC104900415 n=1 Tax=Beta vulgaris subsp. vulgaris TaxID=3555 RepID=UPI0005401521|nr:uncharacterized protein LOC104900415 [Beta vulgaris subsp. vulgaris]
MDDELFPRISSAKTAKEAWDTIKREYFGDKKVIAVKLQSLRSSFDNLSHKEKETVQSYLSRVSGIVNQMKSYGEIIENEKVVSKVLRTLHKDFRHVVAAIEESKDFSTYTFDELMCSLITHEERIRSYDDKVEEKAFQVHGESSSDWQFENGQGRGRGRGRGGVQGSSHGRGYSQSGDSRGMGRGQEENGGRMSSIKCYYCKRFGHKEDRCWDKQRDMKEKEQANLAQKVEGEEERLF